MRAELKELNTDQLRDYVIDLKGIENAHDWKNAKPVTLMELIEEAMANHPEVFWIVEYSEPGDELVEPEVVQIEQKNDQIEQESAQDEQEAAQDEPEVVQEVTPGPEQELAQEVVQIESESAIVGQKASVTILQKKLSRRNLRISFPATGRNMKSLQSTSRFSISGNGLSTGNGH